MKRIAGLFVLVFVLTGCQIVTTTGTQSVSSSPQYVTRFVVNYGNGDFITPVFNANGYVERVDYHNALGEIIMYTLYTYDAENKVLTRKKYEMPGNVNAENYTFTYTDGKLTRLDFIYKDFDNTTAHTLFEYDAQGRVSRWKRYTSYDGVLWAHGSYVYNAEGNIIRNNYYTKWDAKFKLTYEVFSVLDNNITSRQSYTDYRFYDANENVVDSTGSFMYNGGHFNTFDSNHINTKRDYFSGNDLHIITMTRVFQYTFTSGTITDANWYKKYELEIYPEKIDFM